MRKLLFIFAAMLLSSIGLHAETQITYTATEKLELETLNPGATTFGPEITRHSFSGGKGEIECNGNITKIGANAFAGSSNLTSIELPDWYVTTIGEAAFHSCSKLKSITIPNSVTTIERLAFGYCSELKTVTMSDAVTSIGARAFIDCAQLDSITIPSPVTEIGEMVFYKCTRLNKIDCYAPVPPSLGLSVFTNVPQDKLSVYVFDVDAYKEQWNQLKSECFKSIPPIEINGINYEFFGGNKAQVIGKDGGYTGNITIPEQVTYQGLTFTVTEIGQDAFKNCSGLTSITIPSSVTIIWNRAFFGAGLTSITIPNSVTEIGYSAFWGCRDLKSVTISNSVTTIKEQTFNQCSSLTSVTIPNSVTTIENMAFRGCNSLTSIVIPASVKQIEWGTFMESSNLQSVYCYALTPPSRVGGTIFTHQPTVYTFNTGAYIESWSELPASCFKPMPPVVVGDLKYEFFVSNGYKARVIAKDGGYTGNIVIPEQVTYQGMNFAVTEISPRAFCECKSMTSVTIPNSVTTIGERAFWGCGLTSVTIPASVKEIGFVAFKNCTQLKDLQFADRADAIDIGSYVFENTALTAIDIPDWMKEIPEGLFYLNSKLEAIYLPASVRKINQKSFGECTNLKCIVSMAETPPELAEGAFEGHDKDDNVIVYIPTPEATAAYQSSDWTKYFTKIYSYITYRQTSSNTVEVIDAFPINGKVEIPAMFAAAGTFYKVTGIADSAFYKEDSLVSISLPPTIQYIGNNAFAECHRLKDINLEFTEDLQTIGDKAFYYTALDSIVIPEGVQSLGRDAFGFNYLRYVSLPTGLKNIPDDCFRDNYFLTEIIVPEGVETIGDHSFAFAYDLEKVTLITLPSTLKEIKSYAFANRVEFEKVICLAQDPPTLGETIFTNKKTAIVYVPDRNVLRTYRDSSSWKNYKFKFADLMAEANKAYLYEVAGNNTEAQDTARRYCLLIDNAQSTEEVQRYTAAALERIDKLTLTDYKKALADSLDHYAKDNAEAKQIANQYGPQIKNATSRPAAERLFAEAYMKITDIYELIKLKDNYKKQLVELAGGDKDLQKVATDYGALIDRAETKEDARALYERATMRININKQIKSDWNGGSVKVNNHTCTTTKGY